MHHDVIMRTNIYYHYFYHDFIDYTHACQLNYFTQLKALLVVLQRAPTAQVGQTGL